MKRPQKPKGWFKTTEDCEYTVPEHLKGFYDKWGVDYKYAVPQYRKGFWEKWEDFAFKTTTLLSPFIMILAAALIVYMLSFLTYKIFFY